MPSRINKLDCTPLWTANRRSPPRRFFCRSLRSGLRQRPCRAQHSIGSSTWLAGRSAQDVSKSVSLSGFHVSQQYSLFFATGQSGYVRPNSAWQQGLSSYSSANRSLGLDLSKRTQRLYSCCRKRHLVTEWRRHLARDHSAYILGPVIIQVFRGSDPSHRCNAGQLAAGHPSDGKSRGFCRRVREARNFFWLFFDYECFSCIPVLDHSQRIGAPQKVTLRRLLVCSRLRVSDCGKCDQN